MHRRWLLTAVPAALFTLWWWSGQDTRAAEETLVQLSALLAKSPQQRSVELPRLCGPQLHLTLEGKAVALAQQDTLLQLEGWLSSHPPQLAVLSSLVTQIDENEARVNGLLRLSTSEATDLHAEERPFSARLLRGNPWSLTELELLPARTYLPEARP
jgi:hypothetical protein